MFKSNINTDTSIGFNIYIFADKNHMIPNIQNTLLQIISNLQIYHSFLQVYINVKIVEFFPSLFFFFITNIKVGNRIHPFSLKVLNTNSVPV
jgi:hypothetical protein